jgi:ABC-type amino acid transport substrate-binding protein
LNRINQILPRANTLAITALVAAVVILATPSLFVQRTPSPQRDSYSTIVAQKRLEAGYVVLPPWIIKDPNTGALSGSSIDAMNEIARLAGWKVDYQEATFSTYIAGLKSGRYDVVVFPVFITIPRAEAVLFTRPVTYLGNTILVRAGDTRFKNLEDVDKPGIIVAVTQGEQGYDFALTHFKHATVKPISSSDITTVYNEVLVGRADVALGDTFTVEAYARQHPQVRDLLFGHPYSVLPAAWIVRPDDERLKEFFNNAITYLEGVGILGELDRKYHVPNVRPF